MTIADIRVPLKEEKKPKLTSQMLKLKRELDHKKLPTFIDDLRLIIKC